MIKGVLRIVAMLCALGIGMVGNNGLDAERIKGLLRDIQVELYYEEEIEIEKPWESGGKPANEYTWEEFEALGAEQQDAFFDAFESVEAFEVWMHHAQTDAQTQIEKPWENGGKTVNEYTWTEFEALTPEQQDVFFDAFETVEAFEAWMYHAQADVQPETEKPWENRGRTANEYTWKEFEALTPEQKNAFFDTFESEEAFNEWMNHAQADTQTQVEKPWVNGKKAINEYTWEEFEVLSVEEKDAFFDAFETAEAFEVWMNHAQANTQTQVEKPWENGEKAVDEYTWEEFEALALEEQDAFFDAFESVDAFEEWMQRSINKSAGEMQ